MNDRDTILSHLSEGTKHLIDALSIGVVLGTIAQMLPSVAAILTIVWTSIRIWETPTVRAIRERFKHTK